MKQRWECDKCGKFNFVEFEPDEDIQETRNKMIDNHKWVSPECPNENLRAPVFFNASKIMENLR